MIQSTVENRKL